MPVGTDRGLRILAAGVVNIYLDRLAPRKRAGDRTLRVDSCSQYSKENEKFGNASEHLFVF